MRRHLGIRPFYGLGHAVENRQSPFACLLQRLFENILCQTVNLDIHLKGANPFTRPRNLEIHIPHVIFIAKDVGQNDYGVSLFHEPHSDTGHGRFHRNPRIH